MTRLWPILLAPILLPAAQAASVVRCDSDGRVTYQDTPCPTSAQSRAVEAANLPLPPVDVAAIEARRAAFLEQRQRAEAAARDAELARLADAQTALARAQQRQADALDALAQDLANSPTAVYGGYGYGSWTRPKLPRDKSLTSRPDGGYDRPAPRRDHAGSAIDRAAERAMAQRVARGILYPEPRGR